MALLSRVKAAVLFGCLLFASQSFALDYFWSNGVGATGASPSAACTAAAIQSYRDNPVQVYHHAEVTSIFDGVYNPQAACQFYFTWNAASGATDLTTPYPGSSTLLNRGGDTCPTGTGPYDPQTGVCTQQVQYQAGDKCDDQTGGTASNPMIYDDTVSKCVPFTQSEGDAPCTYLKSVGESNPNYTGTAYTVAGSVVGGQAVAPPTFAQDGLKCVMATISSSNCKVGIDGKATCNVVGKFTGKGSSTGELDVSDALCPNGTCAPQEPEVKTSEQPCVPSGTGGGGSGCTQTKETKEDGTQQCGSVNGAYTCVTKKPYSNGITTNISSTSETLPDGSVKVTTVKDSSNTVCTDVNTCTTKTSTTTSHTTTKPNGTTTTDTSCKGACTPNGGGLETNTGAGSGNPATGNGNGGNGDGEGGDGTASATDDCAAPPPCDGDVFLCAILKQDHIDTCKLMADATAEQKAMVKQKTDAAYASLDAHQQQLDTQANTLLSEFQSKTNGSGGTGGKCLPDKQFMLAGHTFSIEFSKTCDSLAWVRLVMLAGAYLIAARIVFREV